MEQILDRDVEDHRECDQQPRQQRDNRAELKTKLQELKEKLSKEGELGRKKITQYTRYGTVVLSIIQSLGISFFLERTTAPGGAPLGRERSRPGRCPPARARACRCRAHGAARR